MLKFHVINVELYLGKSRSWNVNKCNLAKNGASLIAANNLKIFNGKTALGSSSVAIV